MNPPPPDWVQRNAKWFVPAGVLLLAAVIAAFFSFLMGLLKSSEPYQQALARVRSSPAVIAALGTPIEEKFFVRGNIHVSATAGQAQFEIPVKGPKGAATIALAANRAGRLWKFEFLVVQLEPSGGSINLLEPPPKPAPENKSPAPAHF
ncbi:MAG: Fungal protein of unknown function [Verrucomicrobia bacterium]|nr:Fungal protein of unknown function [Verrucomicrobiota bacterium]